MGQTIDDLAGFTTRSLGAPIELLQGNTRQAGIDLGGAFANGIEGVDDFPVVGKYIGPAVASYFGGPLGYGAAVGVQNGVESSRHGAGYGNAALGGLESGSIAAAESYAGGQLGGAIGDALGSGVGEGASSASSDAANGIGGSAGGSMVGTPAATGAPSISSDFGGGSLASGTGIDSGSGSLLSTGNTADNQFMSGNYGGSLATNTGSNVAANAASNAAPQSTGTLNSIGNFLQKNTGQTISNSISGPLNKVGDFFGSPGLGSQIGGSIANHLGDQTLGNTLGGLEGASLSSNAVKGIYDKNVPGPAPVLPGMLGSMGLPGDLSSLNGLDQNQQLSNIATRGVYGGGLGSQDQQYYLNQLNNSLVNSPGNYNPISSLSPINNSYLNQLGLGGYGNTQDLLGALQSWQPPST